MNAPGDLPAAHKWFAVEYNNRSWDLAESPSRTEEQNLEMLLAACASLIHWRAVGTLLNELRGVTLVVTAALKAGLEDVAERFANEGVSLLERVPEALAFDRAALWSAAKGAFRTKSPGYYETACQRVGEIWEELSAEEQQLLTALYSDEG